MAENGEQVMGRFLGAENVERSQAFLEALDPELHRYVIEFVYGQVYSGDVLDPKTRALCTVAMLACLDQQLQLAVYVRSARRQGYGAAPEMVARCLTRCDEDGIRGTVHVLRTLSDTQPVYTQGPVWQLDGKTV